MPTIADDIRELRKFCGTQKEVAKETGYQRTTISRLESNKHSNSTKTIEDFVRKMGFRQDLVVRLVPESLPHHSVCEAQGESIFELMAWKADDIANGCEELKRHVDWHKTVRDCRKVAKVCRSLVEEGYSYPPPIGIFKGDKNWTKYLQYRYYTRLQYLFKLMRKTSHWWF